MPSIPQSLLWISLVVLWLFVLVPMLISKRDTVRRTSDVALATRVLNTGRARGCCGTDVPRPDIAAIRTGNSRRTNSTKTSTTSPTTSRRNARWCARPRSRQRSTASRTISTSTSLTRTRARCRWASRRTKPSRSRRRPREPEDQTERAAMGSRRGTRVRDEPQGEYEPGRHRRRLRVRRRLIGPGGAVGYRPTTGRVAERCAQAPAMSPRPRR